MPNLAQWIISEESLALRKESKSASLALDDLHDQTAPWRADPWDTLWTDVGGEG